MHEENVCTINLAGKLTCQSCVFELSIISFAENARLLSKNS